MDQGGTNLQALNGWQAGRRRLLSAALGTTFSAAFLAACGGNTSKKPSSAGVATQVTAPAQTSTAGTPVPSAASSPAAAQPRRGGTLHTSSTSYPANFDPHKTAAFTDRPDVFSRLYVPEVGPGIPLVTARVVPDAAESAEQVDPITLTVKLRPNVRFHPPIDRLMTTDDVVFSFDRYTGKISGTPESGEDSDVKRIFDSWQAIDAQTIRFKLKQQQANLLYRLGSRYTSYLMPKETGQSYDPNTKAIGSGPWIVDQYIPSTRLTYRRHPAWHLGPQIPYFDTWEEALVPEYATALRQFLGGNIDTIVSIQTPDVGTIAGIKGVKLTQDPAPTPGIMNALTFSGNDPKAPWMDKRVRQAISMGFDRDAIAQSAYDVAKLQGFGFPVQIKWNGVLPAALEDYWLDPKMEGPNKMSADAAQYFHYNPDAAKKLLADAGLAGGFQARLHYVTTFSPAYNTNAELIAEYLSKIGVHITLVADDYQVDYVAHTRNGEFDGLAMIPFGSGWNDPGDYLANMYPRGAARNTSKVNDPDVESKIAAIEKNLDAASRKQQVIDIQNQLASDMYYVPVVAGAIPTVDAYQPWIDNGSEYPQFGANVVRQYWWSTKT